MKALISSLTVLNKIKYDLMFLFWKHIDFYNMLDISLGQTTTVVYNGLVYNSWHFQNVKSCIILFFWCCHFVNLEDEAWCRSGTFPINLHLLMKRQYGLVSSSPLV